ncbi:MAG: ABC transporter ATP-binding protein [Candidatus Hodarchaeales archaeon]|jgi:putative ABC transport system ATP-binding protein
MSLSKSNVLIELKDVHRTFTMGEVEVQALNGANLTIERGEFVVILGPSGSGKTTLLNQIGGIDAPTKGTVIVAGNNISQFNADLLTNHRRNIIGWIFQFFNLIPSLTALENVGLALEMAGDMDNWEERCSEALTLVGLGDKGDRFPSQLSGGEQQRVAIARALVKKPEIIVADEPTGNLDWKTGQEIAKVMQELNEKEGITFAVVSHDISISEVAGRVLYMHDGAVHTEPPSLEVAPAAKKVRTT